MKLTRAGFTTKSAEQAASEFIDSRFTEVASKRDIKDLEAKLAETRIDLIRWIGGIGFLRVTLITALLLKLISKSA